MLDLAKMTVDCFEASCKEHLGETVDKRYVRNSLEIHNFYPFMESEKFYLKEEALSIYKRVLEIACVRFEKADTRLKFSSASSFISCFD